MQRENIVEIIRQRKKFRFIINVSAFLKLTMFKDCNETIYLFFV